jgi:hypothetical protein
VGGKHMPKFLVEIVYSYEIEAESKDIAELHGQNTWEWLFDDMTILTGEVTVRATEVKDNGV